MSTDFDFDGTFNDEAEEETVPEEEEQEEGPGRRSSPLRIILLLLIVLVLLCAVCFLAARTFGIQLPIPGFEGGTPTPAPTQPPPTDVGTLPTEEPTPGEPGAETPPPEETPATEEPQPGVTEEPAPGTTEEPPTTEPSPVTPVPGPTSTPGPPVVDTPVSCDNNMPPTAAADGQPNPAMMGKGQAIVTFDGTASDDPDGTIVTYEWDFGDGSDPQSGETVVHGYTAEGNFVATLTVTDDCQNTAQDTVDVTIVGPTPPASSDEDSGSTGDSTSSQGDEQNAQAAPVAQPAATTLPTMGWCYRVRRGDTLSGLSSFYGVPVADLARANNIRSHHFVRVGESLFIPSAEVNRGPNAYEVQDGDTLHSIASQCDLTVGYLAQVNELDPQTTLTPGQVIYVPLWR